MATPLSILGFTVHTDIGSFDINISPSNQGPGPSGQGHDGGNPPPARGNVEHGLAAAFEADGHAFLIGPDGFPNAEATNAFIDHMADVVGFRIPSGHRPDLSSPDGNVSPDWQYWEADSGHAQDDAPSPTDIVDAIDAAYVAAGVDGPSNEACIAFLFGFNQH